MRWRCAASQVHFRAHSAGRRGELESLEAPLAADRKHAEKAHATARTCVASVLFRNGPLTARFLRRLLSAPELRGYKPLWSLHREFRGRAGVCVLLRPGLQLASPARFLLDLDMPPEHHHDEGRVVALEFATTRLLLTYSPNSGQKGAKLR